MARGRTLIVDVLVDHVSDASVVVVEYSAHDLFCGSGALASVVKESAEKAANHLCLCRSRRRGRCKLRTTSVDASQEGSGRHVPFMMYGCCHQEVMLYTFVFSKYLQSPGIRQPIELDGAVRGGD